MHFSLISPNAIKDSLLARLGLAMGTIALLSFISMTLSTSIADNSLGKANAINSAGSLRMMSYRLLSYAQADAPAKTIAEAASEFQNRLDALEGFVISRAADYSELPARFSQVHASWDKKLSPLLLGLGGTSDPRFITSLEQLIPELVEQINGVVYLIEVDLERKIALLRSMQIALLVMTIMVCLVTMWMMKNQVVRPLKELLRAASRVRDNDLTAKVTHTDQDELGQLGETFNMMVSAIAKTVENQNQLIAERTRELTESNRSLELMYRSALQLSDSQFTAASLKNLLEDIEAELDLSAGAVCISEQGVLPAHQLSSTLSKDALEKICGDRGCEDCFTQSLSPSQSASAGDQKIIFVPIRDAGSLTGVMPFKINTQEPLPAWKMRVLEAIGRNLSIALSKMQHQEEQHRIAVLEERSVIARELHDSIAQSLSYLRIQVARLEKNQLTPEHHHEIVAELKSGLASAYKELRELITAFRLKIDERGFHVALAETAEEFSRRCNLKVQWRNDLPPTLLSANEEIHVIRIIREALANIERHAHASIVVINATVSDVHQVIIQISDNGVGIGDAQSPQNHYGLIIMEDRAQSLNGSMTIRNREQGGTEVVLSFMPEKARTDL